MVVPPRPFSPGTKPDAQVEKPMVDATVPVEKEPELQVVVPPAPISPVASSTMAGTAPVAHVSGWAITSIVLGILLAVSLSTLVLVLTLKVRK